MLVPFRRAMNLVIVSLGAYHQSESDDFEGSEIPGAFQKAGEMPEIAHRIRAALRRMGRGIGPRFERFELAGCSQPASADGLRNAPRRQQESLGQKLI